MVQDIDPQIARCMEILGAIGDMWSLAIVMSLEGGELRFNELQRAIPKVNAVTLSNRLKKLEKIGIVVRAAETRSKQSTVYNLTPLGSKLLPIADTIREVALDLERSGLVPVAG